MLIIANELVQRNLGDKLNFDLQKIGWKIDNAQLIPNNEDIRELFFPKKAQHDAYIAIRRIMQEAKTMITIIDPYIDSSLFSALSAIPTNTLNIHLLTQNIPNDFLQEAKKFIMQYNSFTLEIRRSTELHDRFIIIDNKDCWHIGASIKDAGNKAFMLSKLEDLNNRNALLTQLRDSWSNGILVNI